MNPLDRCNQAVQFATHGLAVAGPGRPQFLAQIEPAQVRLAQLIQLQDKHHVRGGVEFVLRVMGLQVGVDDSDPKVLQALRIIREVADE